MIIQLRNVINISGHYPTWVGLALQAFSLCVRPCVRACVRAYDPSKKKWRKSNILVQKTKHYYTKKELQVRLISRVARICVGGRFV